MPIRCLVRVVLVSIGELLQSGETSPMLIEPEYFFCARVLITKPRSLIVVNAYFFFHFLFFVKLTEEVSIDTIEIVLLLFVIA